ncbi:hypothetical protein BXZ70DRAFT_327974 [Cristinia sonorae]|uniref:BTB domain-containing protein n=1 Tax=Cristinia sonorae TaxID=1940300 RepID=A0A8K0UK29_9AGAR|nr:hypothetical protein BXZ70DRAFT_327974 [Cristinia sonorae]
MTLTTLFAFDDADLVLRPTSPDSDAVDFHVHRCILAASSPFFRQMFTLPQALSEEIVDEPPIPVIEMSETGSTLGALLQFIYPMVDPWIETLDELTLVLDAATKYDMTVARETLRKLLIAPRFVAKWPTRVYAIASRFELEEEAKIASRYTLTVNVLDCPLSEDLKYITAYSYHRLLDLHRSRAKAAQELLLSMPPDNVKCMLCNGTHYGILLAPKWWQHFQAKAREELSLRPTTEIIFSMPFLAQVASAGCDRCAGSLLNSHVFLEELRKKIDDLPATI